LLELFRSSGHRITACNRCGKDMNRVGIPNIVYTFEVCHCPQASFAHLIETLWHRPCFMAYESERLGLKTSVTTEEK
jgi:hypothetical protein